MSRNVILPWYIEQQEAQHRITEASNRFQAWRLAVYGGETWIIIKAELPQDEWNPSGSSRPKERHAVLGSPKSNKRLPPCTGSHNQCALEGRATNCVSHPQRAHATADMGGDLCCYAQSRIGATCGIPSGEAACKARTAAASTNLPSRSATAAGPSTTQRMSLSLTM